MTRSLFIRACGVVAAITAVTCCALTSRADIVTQNELSDVVFVSGASTGASAGYSTGLTTQLFRPVAFSPAVGSSLSFGNAAFRNVLSTPITEQTNVTVERSFYVLGN